MDPNVKGILGLEKHFSEWDDAISRNFKDWRSSPEYSLVFLLFSNAFSNRRNLGEGQVCIEMKFSTTNCFNLYVYFAGHPYLQPERGPPRLHHPWSGRGRWQPGPGQQVHLLARGRIRQVRHHPPGRPQDLRHWKPPRTRLGQPGPPAENTRQRHQHYQVRIPRYAH